MREGGDGRSSWSLACIDGEELDVKEVEAAPHEVLLWFGRPEHRDSKSYPSLPTLSESSETLTDPPDFAKTATGHRIPVFSLPSLLSDDFLAERDSLHALYSPFRSEWVQLMPSVPSLMFGDDVQGENCEKAVRTAESESSRIHFSGYFLRGDASTDAILHLWKLKHYLDYVPGTLQGIQRRKVVAKDGSASEDDAEDLSELEDYD